MPSLSPLQTLPLHAVELIVDHIADNIRIAEDNTHRAAANIDYGFFKNHRILLMPLLWVCRNFRAVVYSRFFKYYGLRCGKGADKAIGRPYGLPPCLEGLDGHFRITAKELTIFIDLLTVYSGKALVALSREPFSGCSFPLVRTLEINLFNGPGDTDATAVPLDVEANISAFVRRIQQMAPKLNMVKLTGGFRLREQISTDILLFDNLTTQLLQLASQIEITDNLFKAPHSVQVDAIRNLTYVHTDSFIDIEQTTRLIRLSAATMQHLVFVAGLEDDFSGVIQDVDGGFVTYPCLHTLVVRPGMYWIKPRRYTFTDAVPFPSLRRLDCRGDYPFGDDLVLFRGNATTLEVLRLTLTRELAAALLRHNVFTHTSHPKLLAVMLKPPLGMVQANHVDDSEIIQLMLDIAPDAAVREISNWYLDQAPPPVLSLLNRHTSIQILALPALRLSLWDAMTLIQSLPLLSDLHAQAPTLDPLPAGATKRTLVKYVCSNYSPMGKRFRCWHFGCVNVKYLKDTVKPFLLLALACPNFDYAAIVYYDRETFAKLLEKTIDTIAFKKHAPRLRRLLPHVQNYC
ncbi:hypothetical protein GGI08_001671 [Coemansia sp. S2]|nr:hypothetical protein GGI08_001671 [Coemansia sp. S2]KAJ2075973.1 hypothetical protein GGH13_000236 [Coemansia sp. S155-1]KAJ2346452.1 hypothetical protein GGH92_003596 [Coemansia sp. RSA 2673]